LHLGKNIELKPLTEGDYPLVHGWFNQPDFMGNFFNIWCISPEEVKKFVTMPNNFWYLIHDRAKDTPAGVICSFAPYSDGEMYHGWEIAYIVHQDSRGKGLASQAASMLINHLFDSTLFDRIIACVVVGNEASCKVLEKAGMSLEGVERRKFLLHGKHVDMRLYSIIREEWVDEKTYRSKHSF
jgi:RimJ/RimL family protein N-acetyltransferase